MNLLCADILVFRQLGRGEGIAHRHGSDRISNANVSSAEFRRLGELVFERTSV
jgi:hypothetical protein